MFGCQVPLEYEVKLAMKLKLSYVDPEKELCLALVNLVYSYNANQRYFCHYMSLTHLDVAGTGECLKTHF